jgi:hypothetical protein
MLNILRKGNIKRYRGSRRTNRRRGFFNKKKAEGSEEKKVRKFVVLSYPYPLQYFFFYGSTAPFRVPRPPHFEIS